MTAKYIIIQAIGLVGTLLFFLSFQCRENRRLFQVQFLSYAIYTVHLLLLGAVTGGLSYVINTVRSLCLGSSRRFAKSRAMCCILCAAQLGVLLLSWAGWISVLPVAANIAATVAGYTRNPRKIRLTGMLINSPLWLVYNLMSGSAAGILDELVSEASMIISVARFGWKALDRVEE